MGAGPGAAGWTAGRSARGSRPAAPVCADACMTQIHAMAAPKASRKAGGHTSIRPRPITMTLAVRTPTNMCGENQRTTHRADSSHRPFHHCRTVTRPNTPAPTSNTANSIRAVLPGRPGSKTAPSILGFVTAKPIDLRSDTVTRPDERMRRAMYEAEVGDDWYGDDPTVNRLQERCAELVGKEAAIYVPTGTLANEIALHVFVRPGHLVVAPAGSHVSGTEVSTAAMLSGIAFVELDAPRAQPTADLVADALRPDPYDVAAVDLVTLENTHNVAGGTIMAIDELRGIRKACEEAGVPLYLDGARIFNASVASGTPVREYAAEADALMFCLSKGLGAPIGSILCGDMEFIREARRAKVLFGGAWRQAGILAAAGLVALEEGPNRLEQDHVNARRLAEGIAQASPGTLDPLAVETNIVYVDTASVGVDPWDAHDRLKDGGVLCSVLGGKVRMLTHRDVTAGDVEETIRRWPAAGVG